MTNPMYPSLIPRYVDESWFASDQPVDEAAKLNELEANHEVWIREAQYRNADVPTPHMDTADEDGDVDGDEDEINEDEDGDNEDVEGSHDELDDADELDSNESHHGTM